MKYIIAATDFSDNADNAVLYAADLASQLQASLMLLNVYPTNIPFAEGGMPPFYMEDAQAESLNLLSSLKEKVLAQINKSVTIHLESRGGSFVGALSAYCDELKPLAVVVGAESKNALGRLAMGGDTLSALKKLSWPLLIIPPKAKFAGFGRIGLACDLEDVVETVRGGDIQSWVESFNAELHIVHVNRNLGGSLDGSKSHEAAWLQGMLDGIHPKYHFPQARELEKGLTDYVKKLNLDLLIVIPKSHSWMENIFVGSHSKDVVLHADFPVMALHALPSASVR